MILVWSSSHQYDIEWIIFYQASQVPQQASQLRISRGGTAAAPKPTKRGKTQLSAADLAVTDVDHGKAWEDFDVGDAVLVFFKQFPMAGKIQAKSKRARTFSIDLQTELWDQPVIVSHRVLEHIDHDIEDEYIYIWSWSCIDRDVFVKSD